MMRRRTGPSLMGTMARTAVIAGTATAVSGKVAQGQQQKAMAQQAAQTAQQQAASQQVAAQAAEAAVAQSQPPAAAGFSADALAQLKQLGDLKAAGILTDEEFSAAKAKILG